MSVMQPNLPYTFDALEPHISAATVSLGFQRYHRMTIDTLNARVADSDYSNRALDQIVDRARDEGDDAVLRDACETWNYGFFWQCMRPFGGGRPEGMLRRLIEEEYGSFAEFRSRFADAARRYAGRGWLWLAISPKGLSMHYTDDGESLAGTTFTPLLVLNLSRYAYVRDFERDPDAYAETFLERIANWDVATAMLEDGLQAKAA